MRDAKAHKSLFSNGPALTAHVLEPRRCARASQLHALGSRLEHGVAVGRLRRNSLQDVRRSPRSRYRRRRGFMTYVGAANCTAGGLLVNYSRRRFFGQCATVVGTSAVSAMIGRTPADAAQSEPLRNWAGNYRYSTTRITSARSLAEIQDFVRKHAHFKVLGTRHCFNGIADSSRRVPLASRDDPGRRSIARRGRSRSRRE